MSNGDFDRVTPSDPCQHCGKGNNRCIKFKDGKRSNCYNVGGAGSIEEIDSSGSTYWRYGVSESKDYVDASSEAGKAKPQRATEEDLHKVYSGMLGLLGLSDAHEKAMTGRGFAAGEAKRIGYRTLPTNSSVRSGMLVEMASKYGVRDLLRVPGFFVNNHGSLSLSCLTGLLIPARDIHGRIVALTSRPDEKLDSGNKYLWVSSARKNGPASMAPVHVPLGFPPQADIVVVTEGLLKADLTSQFLRMPVLGNPGVGNWKHSIPLLQKVGAKTIRIAYDCDWKEKADVAAALVNYAKALKEARFNVEILTWNSSDFKGIDDLLASGASPMIVHGQERDAVLKDAAKVAQKNKGANKRKSGPKSPEQADPGQSAVDSTDGIRPKKAVDDPHRLARGFLNQQFHHADCSTLGFHREDFLRWDGLAYTLYPDVQHDLVADVEEEFNRANQDFIAKIFEWAAKSGKKVERDELPDAMKVTTGTIRNVMQALKSESVISSTLNPPFWLGDGEYPPALEVLPAANGLVDLRDLSIRPPTPLYFSPFALTYKFDKDAPEPIQWNRFLRSLWPNDPDSIRELRKWFGYLLTPDTSKQKMLLMIGPTRCGKGTIIRILTALLGLHNVASPTLASLASQFGLWPLLGKSAAIIADARVAGSASERSAILERLLNITGEDMITIDKKYKEPVTQKLNTRIVILSNEAPNFRDASGALAARACFLKFTETWLGREDHGLTDKLLLELPSILKWAIEGRAMLKEDGNFKTPKSAIDLHQSFGELVSPIKTFTEQCCDIVNPDTREADQLSTLSDLFAAYCEWCRSTKHESGSDSVFSRNLQSAYANIGQERPRLKTDDGFGNLAEDRRRRFRGIELTTEGRAMARRWEQREEPRATISPFKSRAS